MEPSVTGADRESRREGRGRLSSIEMLPEECDEDVAWAKGALYEKKLPQTEILRLLNDRLAVRGASGVSKGAFSRWSVRMAQKTRRIEATREIMDVALARRERTDEMADAITMQKVVLLELLHAEKLDHRKIGPAARLLISLLKEAG